ncbi:MAG: hypothetical protein HUK03_09860 [Bacteroidaceae bacterium]|nr:hypothetical protein [Bacteroidaceae bacterium]
MKEDTLNSIRACMDAAGIATASNFTYINGDQIIMPSATTYTVNNYISNGKSLMENRHVDPEVPLTAYITERDKFEFVRQLAATCSTVTDVVNRLLPVLMGECALQPQVLTTSDFIKALIPHLTNVSCGANYENIRKAFRENTR